VPVPILGGFAHGLGLKHTFKHASSLSPTPAASNDSFRGRKRGRGLHLAGISWMEIKFRPGNRMRPPSPGFRRRQGYGGQDGATSPPSPRPSPLRGGKGGWEGAKAKLGVDFDRPNTVGLARLMATAGENVIKYANTIN
jgi:hypothetical protein